MYKYKSIADMFDKCSLVDKVAYKRKVNGKYEPITYQQFRENVMMFHFALKEYGIKNDSKIAILSENRLEWAVTDYGSFTIGAVIVPIYPSLTPEQINFILKDSDSEILVISQKETLKKLFPHLSDLPLLKTVITMFSYDEETFEGKEILSFKDFLARGKNLIDEVEFKETISKVDIKDLLSIVYTSGTTGNPKGVMLTHENILSNVENSLMAISDIGKDDMFLSFLPLCHIFERMTGHFLAIYCQATIAYAESIDTVAENILEVHPTVMASVPRLYEKVYAKIKNQVDEGSNGKKKIFNWAIGIGKQVSELRQKGEEPKGALKFKYSLAHKLVFSKLHQKMGGELRFFVSGGAPLSREIGEFFDSAGILIIEGYGMTETSPVISCNRLDDYKFGTVGKPINNVKVKIADDGEIIVKGPSITPGYYKNSEATKELIDSQGWLHTGDIGVFDAEGFLKITDRKKNIIVTANGKNIAPQPIEEAIKLSKYIQEIVLIGDKRKFISALVVPEYERFAGMQKEDIYELLNNEINKRQKPFASFERVKKIHILDEPLTLENGELTPTLKVKRKVVIKKFENEIESMYQ